MSRLGGPEQIIVKPKPNVYTVLAAVGMVACILGLIAMIQLAKVALPPNGIFEAK
jgi:hypothetical protein